MPFVRNGASILQILHSALDVDKAPINRSMCGRERRDTEERTAHLTVFSYCTLIVLMAST